MSTVKVSMTTPAAAGSTVTTEVEMIVDENSAEESGREAARLVMSFLEGFGAETSE